MVTDILISAANVQRSDQPRDACIELGQVAVITELSLVATSAIAQAIEAGRQLMELVCDHPILAFQAIALVSLYAISRAGRVI